MDDIIRMAREAGFRSAVLLHAWGKEDALCDSEIEELRQIERFAALVTAPLQERIQDLYKQLDEAERELDSQYKLGMEAEREAMLHLALLHGAPWHFQEAIRARGNT
jgi:transposase-like protein